MRDHMPGEYPAQVCYKGVRMTAYPRIAWYLAALLFGLLIVAGAADYGAASAQTAPEVSLIANEADVSAFPEVTLAVTVRNANGVPVTGLTAADFEVLEAGISEPRPILEVSTRVNPDTELSVILLLDISNSMSGAPLTAAKEAAIAFLRRLGPGDRAAVIAFRDEIDFASLDDARESGFTTDKIGLVQLIEGLEAGGGTPLYDALLKAVRLAATEPAGHRAILLLTDGVDEDTTGGPGSVVASEDTPVDEAQEANLPIFTIGLGNQFDAGYLQRLELTTGGLYQQAPDQTALLATFQNVSDLLKQQYLVTYSSGYECDGAVHRVEVRVEAAGAGVSDRITIGPLPLEPDCNPLATPATLAPTTDATPAATDTPVPPTATSSPTLLPPEPTATPQTAAPDVEGGAPLWPWLLGIGAVVIVGGGGIYWFFIRKKEPARKCMNCGHSLGPHDVNCPNCGSPQSFEKIS